MDFDPEAWGRAIINVADALLFGIPSTALLDDIRKGYDLDYADAVKLIEKTQEAIRAEDLTLEKLQEDRNNIGMQLLNYSPLGEFRATLQRDYADKGAKVAESTARLRELNRTVEEQTTRANQAQINKGKSLGTEAMERVFNA